MNEKTVVKGIIADLASVSLSSAKHNLCPSLTYSTILLKDNVCKVSLTPLSHRKQSAGQLFHTLTYDLLFGVKSDQ